MINFYTTLTSLRKLSELTQHACTAHLKAQRQRILELLHAVPMEEFQSSLHLLETLKKRVEVLEQRKKISVDSDTK